MVKRQSSEAASECKVTRWEYSKNIYNNNKVIVATILVIIIEPMIIMNVMIVAL